MVESPVAKEVEADGMSPRLKDLMTIQNHESLLVFASVSMLLGLKGQLAKPSQGLDSCDRTALWTTSPRSTSAPTTRR